LDTPRRHPPRVRQSLQEVGGDRRCTPRDRSARRDEACRPEPRTGRAGHLAESRGPADAVVGRDAAPRATAPAGVGAILNAATRSGPGGQLDDVLPHGREAPRNGGGPELRATSMTGLRRSELPRPAREPLTVLSRIAPALF